MTESVSIVGEVAPSRQAVAEFPFYTGPVGVRERAGWIDVAFFAPKVRVRLPVAGTLDGQPVHITAVSARLLDPADRTRDALCAMTAVVQTEA